MGAVWLYLDGINSPPGEALKVTLPYPENADPTGIQEEADCVRVEIDPYDTQGLTPEYLALAAEMQALEQELLALRSGGEPYPKICYPFQRNDTPPWLEA